MRLLGDPFFRSLARPLGWGGRPGSSPSSLLTGLVAYWKLNEASGARADAFGANHLTDNNTVAQAAGKIGNSALFVAANTEFLSIVDNVALSIGPGVSFSISFGFWRDVVGVSQGIIAKGTSAAASGQEYEIQALNSNRLMLSCSDGTSVVTTTNATPIDTVDTWYHGTVGYDSGAGTIFAVVNGSVAGRTTASLPSGVRDGTGSFVIGRRSNAASYLDGQVDEVKVWKRLLTDAEIAADYANFLASTPLL